MEAMDAYTCEQAYHLLDAYVDRELSADEIRRLEKHLATCAQCAREARYESGLLQGLKRKIRQIDVPPSAVRRIEEIFERNRHTDSRAPVDADDIPEGGGP